MTDEQPQHDGRTAPQHATEAEESLLAIAQLAETHDRPLDAEAIYRTLSGLTRMLDQLPEAVTRLRAVVVQHHEDGTLAVQGPGDPDAVVATLTEAVDTVLAGFGAVRTNLDKAQAALAGLRFEPRAATDEGAGSDHGQ